MTAAAELLPIAVGELEAKVGCDIGVSDWIVVDQPLIDAFAAVSGDHQFIHVDPVRAAAETPFGGTIAHGFLVLSLVSQMRAGAVPRITGTAMGINYGLDKVRFTNPVPAGSRIRGRFALAAFERRAGGQVQMTWGVTVEIEGQDKPALIASWLTRAVLRD